MQTRQHQLLHKVCNFGSSGRPIKSGETIENIRDLHLWPGEAAEVDSTDCARLHDFDEDVSSARQLGRAGVKDDGDGFEHVEAAQQRARKVGSAHQVL